MTKQKINIKTPFIAILFVVFCFIMSVSWGNMAYADSYSVEFLYAENVDFDGEIEEYNFDKFARGITVYFEVYAPHYIIFIYNSLGDEIDRSGTLDPNSNNIGEYNIVKSGTLTIRCYAIDNDGMMRQDVYDEIQVKSDNLDPEEPDINLMQEWISYERGFTVQINLNEDNGASGVYKADIKIVYDDEELERTIVSPETNDGFEIFEDCVIYLTVYDYAGNRFEKSYKYNKFDSTPPTPPTINLTPNIEVGEQTNGYARRYDVSISFGEDDKSGIDSTSMKYTLNGEIFDYKGAFNLNEQKNYTITAYYQDNAGNTSDIVDEEVKNIDRIEPVINSKALHIDLMDEKPYKLRIQTTDSLSGVERLETQGVNVEFEKQQYNWYEGTFDSLAVESIIIRVFDKVGNSTTTNILTHYFSDPDMRDWAEYYNSYFLTLEQEEYAQMAWGNIISLYSQLNIMFMSEDTSPSEFDNIFSQIDNALEGAVQSQYSINSVPDRLRTGISYEIDENDLSEFKKGDIITLILYKASNDPDAIDGYENTAIGLCDFEKCFAIPFRLGFNYNQEAMDYEFESGVMISIPVPYGFEERYFEVVDLQNNQLLESQTINNEVIFSIDNGGIFALVVEGEETMRTDPQPKGVMVFGKLLSWGVFWGVIAGAVVLAGGLITILTIKQKKQK